MVQRLYYVIIYKEVFNMIIFKENKKTGLQCGLNDFDELFLGDDRSGYNLPNTEENKIKILQDFDFWNKQR